MDAIKYLPVGMGMTALAFGLLVAGVAAVCVYIVGQLMTQRLLLATAEPAAGQTVDPARLGIKLSIVDAHVTKIRDFASSYVFTSMLLITIIAVIMVVMLVMSSRRRL